MPPRSPVRPVTATPYSTTLARILRRSMPELSPPRTSATDAAGVSVTYPECSHQPSECCTAWTRRAGATSSWSRRSGLCRAGGELSYGLHVVEVHLAVADD